MIICDGDGYELCAGLGGDEARRAAQEEADERGESVWLSEEGSAEMGEEFVPGLAPTLE